MNVTRNNLIAGGVRNLKEFGYQRVDAENILTDYVYWGFFKKMLQDYEDTIPAAAELIREGDSKVQVLK